VLLVIGNLGIDASCRWKCRGAKSMEFETNGWMEDKIRVIIKSREACMSHHHDMLHDYVMPRHGIHYETIPRQWTCAAWIGLDWMLNHHTRLIISEVFVWNHEWLQMLVNGNWNATLSHEQCGW